jgi:hypothetical protein
VTTADEIASAMATEDNEAFRAAVEKFRRQTQQRGVPSDEARDLIQTIITQELSRLNAKS